MDVLFPGARRAGRALRRTFEGGFGRRPRRRQRMFVETAPIMRPVRAAQRFRGVSKSFKRNYLKLKENEFIDTTISETPVEGTSDIQCINCIGVGDTQILRDGEATIVSSIQLRLKFVQDINAIIPQYVDVIMVLKRDVRATTITMTNLFVSDNLNSMRQVQNSKNFKILMRRRIKLSTIGAPVDITQDVKYLNYYKKYKNGIRVKYLSTAADVTGLDRNGIFLIFMTDALATFLPTITGAVRVVFKEV